MTCHRRCAYCFPVFDQKGTLLAFSEHRSIASVFFVRNWTTYRWTRSVIKCCSNRKCASCIINDVFCLKFKSEEENSMNKDQIFYQSYLHSSHCSHTIAFTLDKIMHVGKEAETKFFSNIKHSAHVDIWIAI